MQEIEYPLPTEQNGSRPINNIPMKTMNFDKRRTMEFLNAEIMSPFWRYIYIAMIMSPD